MDRIINRRLRHRLIALLMVVTMLAGSFGYNYLFAGIDTGGGGVEDVPTYTFTGSEKVTLTDDGKSIVFKLTHKESNASIKYETEGWLVDVTVAGVEYVNVAALSEKYTGDETEVVFKLSDFFTSGFFDANTYVELPAGYTGSKWLYWSQNVGNGGTTLLNKAKFNTTVSFELNALQTILVNGEYIWLNSADDDVTAYGYDLTEWNNAFSSDPDDVMPCWEEYSGDLGINDAVTKVASEVLGLSGINWSSTASTDLETFHGLTFSADITVLPRDITAELEVTSTDTTLDSTEASLPVDLQVRAYLRPDQDTSEYYDENDIDYWKIFIHDQKGNYVTQNGNSYILIEGNAAKSTEVTVNGTIEYTRLDLDIGANDITFQTEAYVYYKDEASGSESSDDQAITILTAEQTTEINVILDLDKTPVNINEEYTLTNSTYIPSGVTVSDAKLYEVVGVEQNEIAWDGESITLSKPAATNDLKYILEIMVESGADNPDPAEKSVEVVDNTPVDFKVRVSAPGSVYEGETYYVKNKSSIQYGEESLNVTEADDLGLIDSYQWYLDGDDRSKNLAKFSQNYTLDSHESRRIVYSLDLEVDGVEDSDSDATTIKPTPDAGVVISGEQKENRLVTFTESTVWHPDYVGVSLFTVEPVSEGLTANDIKTSDGVNYIFKTAGEYSVTITSTDDRGYVDTDTVVFTIDEDVIPLVEFNAPTLVLRNSDTGIALVTAKDIYTRSLDGDSIADRLYGYKYDDDFDGYFTDESLVTVAEDVKSTDFNLNYAGNYQFYYKATERFGTLLVPDETLPSFISSSDYKSDSATLEVTVDNAAPISTINASMEQMVNISVLNGSSALSSEVSSSIASLETELISRGIMVNDVSYDEYSAEGMLYPILGSYFPSVYSDGLNGGTSSYEDISFYSDFGVTGKFRGLAVDLNTNYLLYTASASNSVSSPVATLGAFDLTSKEIVWTTDISGAPSEITSARAIKKVADSDTYYAYMGDGGTTWWQFDKYTGEVTGEIDSSLLTLDMGDAANVYSKPSVLSPVLTWSYTEQDDMIANGVYADPLTYTDISGNTYRLRYYRSSSYYYIELTINNAEGVEIFNEKLNHTGHMGHVLLQSWEINGKALTIASRIGGDGVDGDRTSARNSFFDTVVVYGDEYGTYSYDSSSDCTISNISQSTVSLFGNGMIKIRDGYSGTSYSRYRGMGYAMAAISTITSDDLFYVNQGYPYGYGWFLDAHGALVTIPWYGNTGSQYIRIYDQDITNTMVPSMKSEDIASSLVADESVLHNYVVVFNDGDLSVDGDLIGQANDLNNVFIEVSSVESNTALTDGTGGTYIDSDYGFNSVINQIADYIETEVENETESSDSVLYLVEGQSLSDMTGFYWDYESDPIVSTAWKITQDLSEFDHNDGVSAYHNKTYSSPVLSLDVPGRYDIDYQVLDDPPDPLGISNGKYSSPTDFSLYYHQKPVAVPVFTAYLGSQVSTNVFTKNTIVELDLSGSYDPDVDDGIVESKVLWKFEDDSVFAVASNQNRFELDQDGNYLFKIYVKDLWGAWSEVKEVTLSTSGSVSVQRAIEASLNVPDEVYVGQDIEGVTVAYDAINTTLSSEILQISEHDANDWTTISVSNFRNGNYSVDVEGTYDVRYTVNGSYSTSDTVTETFDVIPVSINAELVVEGSFKENRKLSLEVVELPSNIHTINSIDVNFVAVGDGAVKSTSYEQYTSKLKRDFLHKDSGDYTIEVTMYTTINSVTYSKTLTYDYSIVPDEAPTIEVTGLDTYSRDELGVATINLGANATSQDDYVESLEWSLRKVGGSWTDLTSFDDIESLEYELTDVDQYQVRVRATEGFLEDTIAAFVTSSDYLYAEEIFELEIVNIAPTVDFYTDKTVYLLGDTIEITNQAGDVIQEEEDNVEVYNDADGDALATFDWTITHDPSVMPNADSISSFHNDVLSSVQSFSVFDSRGEYTITATATDSVGGVGTKSKIIIVHEAPDPALTLSSPYYSEPDGIVLEGVALQVNDASTDPDGYAVTSEIEYKEVGGTYTTVADGGYISVNSTDLVVKVTTTDNYGVSRTAYEFIEVLPNSLDPTVTPSTLPVTETVTLDLETDTSTLDATAVIFSGTAYEATVTLGKVSETTANIYYSGTYIVPDNVPDDSYVVDFESNTMYGFALGTQDAVTIETPLDLTGFINGSSAAASLYLGEDNELTAETSEYVSDVTVNILSTDVPMTWVSTSGGISTWSVTIYVDEAVGEISDTAVFTANTVNGTSGTYANDGKYDVGFMTEVSLAITGYIDPNPALAGEQVEIICATEGAGESVVVDLGNVASGVSINLTPDTPITNRENTWRSDYIVPLETDDGSYDVVATVYREMASGTKSESVTMTLIIDGNMLQLVKPSIKDGN